MSCCTAKTNLPHPAGHDDHVRCAADLLLWKIAPELDIVSERALALWQPPGSHLADMSLHLVFVPPRLNVFNNPRLARLDRSQSNHNPRYNLKEATFKGNPYSRSCIDFLTLLPNNGWALRCNLTHLNSTTKRGLLQMQVLIPSLFITSVGSTPHFRGLLQLLGPSHPPTASTL